MRMTDAAYLEAWQKAVEQFNAEAFFESHETLEAVWLQLSDETEKQFTQAIIQVAAAMIKLKERNKKGLKSTLDKLLPKIEMALATLNVEALIDFKKLHQELLEINDWCNASEQNNDWPIHIGIKSYQ